jgi:hypothetical protein
MSENEPEYVFDEVQIGKGLKPLAQHGHVVIDHGTLTLLGSDNQTIASASLSSVSAAKVRFTRGQTLSLTMSGEKYNVSPGWGRNVGTFVLPGDAKPVKNAAEMLLKLIERGGGASG